MRADVSSGEGAVEEVGEGENDGLADPGGVALEETPDQCFDGASSMSGKKNGVAKRISELEPRAIFTHCYGHALNLAASDTIKQSKIMKDALDTTHEVIKLIKYSPRREAIFKDIKEAIPGESNPGIRVLCPTRWTV